MEIRKAELPVNNVVLKETPKKETAETPEKNKSILTKAKDWFKSQTDDGTGGDFGVKIAAGSLTVAGAGAGGYLAHKNVSDDQVFIKYHTEEALKTDLKPPDPGKVFTRTDIRILGEFMKSQSGSPENSQRIMNFLAYLAETRPDTNVGDIGQIYDQVQAHSAGNAETFKTLQVMGAVLEKNPGMSLDEAYFEFRTVQNHTPETGDAVQSYIDKFGLDEFDYSDKVIKMVPTHTSPLWRLGKAGAAVVGALGGAMIGAAIGGVVALIHKVVAR